MYYICGLRFISDIDDVKYVPARQIINMAKQSLGDLVPISHAELMQSMSITAQLGHQNTFNELMQTLVDLGKLFSEKCGVHDGERIPPGLWYYNLAIHSVNADILTQFIFAHPEEKEIFQLYERVHDYGPTMSAYSNFLDLNGLELIAFVQTQGNPKLLH